MLDTKSIQKPIYFLPTSKKHLTNGYLKDGIYNIMKMWIIWKEIS